MRKVYYDSDTGFLCARYPKGLAIVDGVTPYIEVSDEDEEATYHCPIGKAWVVRNGTLKLVDEKSDESEALAINNEIMDRKQYLADTDYVVIKMYEASLGVATVSDDDAARYDAIIRKRAETRESIAALEERLPKWQKALDNSLQSSDDISSK